MIKRTPQEIADFFGCYIAMNKNGAWYGFNDKPELAENTWRVNNKGFTFIPETMIDFPFNHDWKQLYEPRKSDVINGESGKNCQKDDLCPHQSEVHTHKECLIIEGESTLMLQYNVNFWLREGYELQGSPFVMNNHVYQAMVRGI